MAGHDIIVIGASMGGVEVLSRLVAQFPEDLPASVFVVQHVHASAAGHLARILDHASPLPVTLTETASVLSRRMSMWRRPIGIYWFSRTAFIWSAARVRIASARRLTRCSALQPWLTVPERWAWC